MQSTSTEISYKTCRVVTSEFVSLWSSWVKFDNFLKNNPFSLSSFSTFVVFGSLASPTIRDDNNCNFYSTRVVDTVYHFIFAALNFCDAG